MGRLICMLALLVLPTWCATHLLKIVGYRIGSGVRVGFSIVLVDALHLGDNVNIGHFNFIKVRRLMLKKSVHISRANILSGPFSLIFEEGASLGNRNKITRGPSPTVVAWGAILKLGREARITADHLIDMTRSVHLGAYSILAGSGTQIWTHGYIHATDGPYRYRVDGKVVIGDNVYVGSRCIINLGLHVVSAAIVGAGAVVSKSLTEPGLYVSVALRSLPRPIDPSANKSLSKEDLHSLCEDVYLKGE